MVWTDPFAYCVQKVGPRWFGSTGLPIGSRLQNVGPTYLGPTRPDGPVGPTASLLYTLKKFSLVRKFVS